MPMSRAMSVFLKDTVKSEVKVGARRLGTQPAAHHHCA